MSKEVNPLVLILREVWVLLGVHDPAVGCQVQYIVIFVHELSFCGLVREQGIGIMLVAEVWAISQCVLSLPYSDCNGVTDRKAWHVRLALSYTTLDLQFTTVSL